MTQEPTEERNPEECKPAPRKRGPVAGTAEAQRGGQAMRALYGQEYFARIGKQGGENARRRHGPEFYTEIGKKGGESTKRRLGSAFYAEIGKKGGLANRKPSHTDE